MSENTVNINNKLTVRRASIEAGSKIDSNYLFSLQPYIEGGNLDNALNKTTGVSASYTIETINDADAPYGKVVKFPNVSQTLVAAYDIDIPVDAGDRVYMELTYMIPATDSGTDSRMYLGFNGFDKDKKKINSNFGLITYVVSNLQLTADGDWRTIGGYTTIPSSHTPYDGSDGGAVRYIKNYVLVNYNGGDREVYISNLVVRKVDTFKDDADVSFSGSVGIGTDDPSVDLEVKNVDTNPVVRVSNDGGVSDEPRLQLYRNSGDYGQIHFEAGGGSNSGLHITNFRGSNSQIIFNTEGDNERMRISTDGEVGIGTTLPQSPLHIYTGNGGTYTPNTNHDDLTIEGSTNIGLQLFSPSSTYQYIAFGDPSSVNAGYIRYYHGNNEMVFRTNGGDRFTINSTGDVRLHSYGNGSNTGTAAYTLAVDSTGTIIEVADTGGGSTPSLQDVTDVGNTTTNDIGIQTTNPVSALHVGDGNNTISSDLYSTDIVNVSAQNTAPGFNIISAGSSTYNRGVFKATRSKGTLASPTTVSSGDYVFSLLGAAFNGSTVAASAGIEMLVDGVVTQNATPQRIEFQTSTSNTRLTRMTIKSSGDVGIGTTAPAARLHIKGSGTTYSADALLVENSSGTDLLKITNTGLFTMDYTGASNTIAIVNYDGNNMNIGSSSVLVGHDAGVSSNLTGTGIVAIGEGALFNCSAASSFSTAVGYRAGRNSGNIQLATVLGYYAGYNAGSSYSSVFIGQEAGRNSTGLTYSIVIGARAGYGTTHSGTNQNNVIIGDSAAYNATGLDDGNTIIGARMLYNSTEVLDNTVIIGSYNAERLRIDSTGKFKFDSYGAGTFSGTAKVNLEADSSGNIIERKEERGTFSGTTDAAGRLAISHSIGSTPTIAMITTDGAAGSIVTASVISKSSTTVSIATNQASTDISGYYIFSD